MDNSDESRFRRQVSTDVKCVAAYQIWWARNDVLWNSKIDMMYKQVYKIKQTIIDRIYNVLPKKVSRCGKIWLSELALDCN